MIRGRRRLRRWFAAALVSAVVLVALTLGLPHAAPPAGVAPPEATPSGPPSQVPALPPPPATEWPGVAWTFAGRTVSASVISLTTGFAACAWASLRFVTFDARLGEETTSAATALQYVRDPLNAHVGDGRASTVGRFESGAAPPADVLFTGYRYGGMELWRSQSAGDDVIFLLRGTVWEQWPRARTLFACA